MIGWALAALVRLLCGCQTRHAELPDPDRATIYYANHTSNLDAVALWAALPEVVRRRTRVVAARDYWERGVVRRFVARRVFRAILIERKRVTRKNSPLPEMVEVLEGGESVIIFPEGTRSMDGETGAFRSGVWHLARRVEDVTLVPVWIENLNRVLPKGEVLPVPVLAAVEFGARISLRDGECKEEFLGRAREVLLELQRGRG